ncbi:MAG: enoyl-CoA hydratase [Herpetosiphonaceae bacterium]|nr:MAG: enoyl-CoA hydratase [Herpetosiphonaceae bacterium]
MTDHHVLVEFQGPVAIVTLNRPQVRNAIDVPTGDALLDALLEVEYRSDIRAVVLAGAGGAFSAGGDLRAITSADPEHPGRALKHLTVGLHAVITSLRRLPQPVIAAVQGNVGGAGWSLALACDLVVMGRSATFRSAYTAVGLTPDGGLTHALVRLLGQQRATELFLTNRPMGAEEALATGLVNRVVDDAEVLPSAVAWAQELAQGPARAFALVKSVVETAASLPLEAQLEQERQAISAAAEDPDFAEGVAAFMAKRRPEFGKRRS